MRNKVAKEIRSVIAKEFPHLLKEGNEKAYRKVYQKIKRQYKATPWNQKNKVVVN